MNGREFDFTEELGELRTLVRQFCEEQSPEDVVRTTMDSEAGFDPALWRRLGTDLGVLGLHVPEAYGGGDAGLVAQAVVVEELGAALVCGPVLGTLALAVPVLCALSREDVKETHLPGLVSGDRVGTIAGPLLQGTFDAAGVTVTAVEADGGWRLNGAVGHVPDGAAADLVLVPARTPAGTALFLVEGAPAQLRRTPLTTLDQTRRQAELELVDCPAVQIADETETAQVCEQAARVAAVLLAAEQVGGAQVMLGRTVEHASGRYQFGVPIGSFQAVKHRCADMLVAVEQARSAAYHGAWSLQDGTDDPALAASMAKAVASDSYVKVAAAAIQLHGGTGFSWEYPAHLYFKRAATDAVVLGSTEQHIDRIAALVLDAAPGR